MKIKKYISAAAAMLLCFACGCSANDSSSKTAEPTDSKSTADNAVSEKTTAPAEKSLIEKIIDKMSLKEKVCQLFVVTPEELTGVDGVTQAGEITKSALKEYPVGGIIYFSSNITSAAQLTEMSKNLQSYTNIPLLISTDEEGGAVARVAETLNETKFDPMYFYRELGADAAKNNANTIGQYLKKYGINTDFAPVADVWSNPSNTVIGTRAYRDDYTGAGTLVSAAVKGFKESGEICCLKHFPGHGDTAQDSHQELAHVTKTIEEIKQNELTVFRSGIDAGADMVMVGHLIVDESGNRLPATLSQSLVKDLLREELDFDGVAITDSMEMGAIADNYGIGSACVQVLNAGIDMILMPSDLQSSVETVIESVENGELSQERIDEALTRVIKMKTDNGIINKIT